MATWWDVNEAPRIAERILELAKPYVKDLEGRVAAGFFDGLKSDAAIVRARGDVEASRSTKKAATVSQDVAVREGGRMVVTIRELVRRGAPKDKELWKAFGVGGRIGTSVSSVSSSIGEILNALNRYPGQAQALGILATDVTRLQGYLSSIASVDADQEAKKLTSKQATAQFKAAVERLSSNLTLLATVAKLALPADVAAEFEAALPSAKSKKKPEARKEKAPQ